MSAKSEYMLLFRGTDWAKGLSPEEIQNVMDQWKGWFDGLVNKGVAKTGRPLEHEGKIVSGRNGRVVVADGPFAESKEAIGGYFILEVSGQEEAVAIAKSCPGLAYGAVVEVRQLAQECPCARDLASEEQLAHAAA
ncbi:MAG TPA: YciI family protein [Verrucomicrobiae bacterium]|jgi:hypothetical protein|nr:YciI family protein [Verrucomicrobiae bacterium]